MDRTKKIRIVTFGVLVFFVLVIVAGVLSRTEDIGPLKEEGKVAVIRVSGPIVGGSGDDFSLSGTQTATSGALMKQFRKARMDDSVKAVLLRLDSPGGSTAATQEAATELQRLKETGKPVIVSMGDTAASGAYWLAAYGDKVYANPSTITGSIGVYMSYYDLQGLSEKVGVKEEKIKSGVHKDIFSPFRPMTDDERQLTQTMVNNMYDQFVTVVAKERHMDEQKVRALADGRVFTGQQALDAGLVDEMGNYYDALAYAGQLIGDDDPDKVPTVTYDDTPTLQQLLQGKITALPTWQALLSQTGSGANIHLPLLLMKGVWQQ